ncbi:MAG: RidA family protein [Opitutales bacterium]
MDVREKLRSLDLELPAPPAPAGSYVPYRRAGSLIYCAGVLSSTPTGLLDGKIGAQHDVTYGQAAARACALNALALLEEALCGFEHLGQLVLINGYVNADAGFAESPQVLNGASDLFREVLGERGAHARAAVAVAGLPKNAAVEIQVVAEAKS